MASSVKVVAPGSRAARTAATRRRMVTAAYTLFCEQGYQPTTMVEIAREAGVAVQTLYFTFHTKSALLQEAFYQAVLGPDPMPPHRQPWFERMRQATDVRVAVGHAVGGSAAIFARVAPLIAAIRAVSADNEVADVYAGQETMRRRAFAEIIELLAAKQPLRAGFTIQRATDIFLVLLSPDVYRAFVVGCAWTLGEYESWATEALYRQLFGSAETG